MTDVVMRKNNLCLECGACCAFFRASFHWAEADDTTPGGVPAELTDDINQTYRVMKGTDRKNPRCVALEGAIGKSVHCSIYERRPSICRNFIPSYEDGKRDERCDKARLAHGLRPILPGDWFGPDHTREPAA